ncbi:MAG: hypothetical protein AAFY76_08180 [Cyanobacteria bacterium J06649_11]
MTIEEEKIATAFRRKAEKELLDLATNPNELRLEAIPILVTILEERQIGKDEVDKLRKNSKLLFHDEYKYWLALLDKTPCPGCKQMRSLVGFTCKKIFSVVRTHEVVDTLGIACSACSRNKKKAAISASFLGGWWSITGFLLTPLIIMYNLFLLVRGEKDSDSIKRKFIYLYYADLRLDKKLLGTLLSRHYQE